MTEVLIVERSIEEEEIANNVEGIPVPVEDLSVTSLKERGKVK